MAVFLNFTLGHGPPMAAGRGICLFLFRFFFPFSRFHTLALLAPFHPGVEEWPKLGTREKKCEISGVYAVLW